LIIAKVSAADVAPPAYRLVATAAAGEPLITT